MFIGGMTKQWYFTDAGAKIRNQNLTIGLPKGKERYRYVNNTITNSNFLERLVCFTAIYIYHFYHNPMHFFFKSTLYITALMQQPFLASSTRLGKIIYSYLHINS